MKKLLSVLSAAISMIAMMQSCKKDNSQTKSTDTDLYNEISKVTGYTFYVGTPGIIARLGNSPHGYERIRFNSIAQAVLDSTGKRPSGALFPAGSIMSKKFILPYRED